MLENSYLSQSDIHNLLGLLRVDRSCTNESVTGLFDCSLHLYLPFSHDVNFQVEVLCQDDQNGRRGLEDLLQFKGLYYLNDLFLLSEVWPRPEMLESSMT